MARAGDPMPRYKSRPTIVPWLSAKQDNREKRFIQVGDSLLFSEAFTSLHVGARYLYFCMAMESAGKRNFQFPTSAAKKYGISSSSFWAYVQELFAGGFIEYRSNKHLRRANDYRFSEVWKSSLFPYHPKTGPMAISSTSDRIPDKGAEG